MIAALFLLVTTVTSVAAESGGWAPAPPPLSLAAGIEATAERMEGALNTGQLTFTGNVQIISGTDQLRAARVDLTLETARHTMRRVVAKGAVQLVYGPYTATAEVAEFDAPAGRSTLTGNAKIWGAGREVAGERIEIDTTRRTVAVAAGHLLVPAQGKRAGVQVVATSIAVDDLAGQAHLQGKVEVISGKRHLWADTIDLHMHPHSGEVERIDARGGVRVVDGSRQGSAAEAHYDLLHHQLILAGQAHLMEGEDEIRGEEIHLNLQTRQVRVERGTIRYQPK